MHELGVNTGDTTMNSQRISEFVVDGITAE
jgi:hypothetical protein